MNTPKIEVKRISKQPKHDPNDPLTALWGDLPNEVPHNVPQDAISWYEATAWVGNQPFARETGWTKSDAVKNLYIRLHSESIERWQNEAIDLDWDIAPSK
jgi:hypothetical protein